MGRGDKLETDPTGPLESNANRVIRGGSWLGNAQYVRAVYRRGISPQRRLNRLGIRCARIQT
ncbi:MAG: SUMF1/EgtB/PvdO family nonheme iron enzyme [Azospirillum sp.]|nr:SUMF1/EgtB/PvdO family nonheme iron enzyme [Azospirillum sp.]